MSFDKIYIFDSIHIFLKEVTHTKILSVKILMSLNLGINNT